jgi:hypothetical protein
MDPHDQFCHNSEWLDRGQSGLGNIRIHSQKRSSGTAVVPVGGPLRPRRGRPSIGCGRPQTW